MYSNPETLIRFECGCGAKIKVPASKAGQKGRCKACGSSLTVPLSRQNGPLHESDESAMNNFEKIKRIPDHGSAALPQDGMQFDIKLLLGLMGSIALFIGPFAPLFSIPLAGSQNFFRLHWFPPTAFLALAVLSLVFSLIRKHVWLWVMGSSSAALVAFTIIGYIFRVEIIQAELKRQMGNDPFAGLARSMAEVTAETMRLEWGIGAFIVGTCLIIAAAAIPGKSRFPQLQQMHGDMKEKASAGSEAIFQGIAGILGKMRQSIDKGITRAGIKSKEALETARIKYQIIAMKDRKDMDLENLGEIVYDMCANNRLSKDPLKKKCQALAELDKQIQENEGELRRIQLKAANRLQAEARKGIAQCACGVAIADDAQFCTRCGAKLKQKESFR